MKKQRLDKFVSTQLNIPRSMAKTQIHRGKVKVGDIVQRNPAFLFDAENTEVFYKGEKVEYKEYVYILMNKPKGLLCATEDKNQKTVLDIVPKEYLRKDLFPVGRLDKDTTGLLIITNDGQFAHKCIAPSKTVGKTYIAELDGPLTEDMIQIFKTGVILADGTRCKPALLKILGKNIAELTITEGKYHQIKRMFGTFSLGVNELKRVKIGNFSLPDILNEGECMLLSQEEIKRFLV